MISSTTLAEVVFFIYAAMKQCRSRVSFSNMSNLFENECSALNRSVFLLGGTKRRLKIILISIIAPVIVAVVVAWGYQRRKRCICRGFPPRLFLCFEYETNALGGRVILILNCNVKWLFCGYWQ